MSFWRKLTEFHEKYDPLFKAGKKLTYDQVRQDSDNMEGIGRAIGWDWLEQEGKRNQGNPGRAIGKAAATAASIRGRNSVIRPWKNAWPISLVRGVGRSCVVPFVVPSTTAPRGSLSIPCLRKWKCRKAMRRWSA